MELGMQLSQQSLHCSHACAAWASGLAHPLLCIQALLDLYSVSAVMSGDVIIQREACLL